MKGILIAIAGAICIVAAAEGSESYRVSVTRTEQNLYRIDGSKLYIKTRYCYEYSYGQEAIRTYSKYSYDNSLFFISSKTSCDVDKLLSE